jgi:hypothetical protein
MGNTVSSITVFAGPAVEAALVRTLLESAGITVHLDGEHIGNAAPHIASGGGANAVKVKVAMDHAARAREILASRGENS